MVKAKTRTKRTTKQKTQRTAKKAPPKIKSRVRRTAPASRRSSAKPVDASPPAPSPTPPEASVAPAAPDPALHDVLVMRERLARERSAALMSRTVNIPWVRKRCASFETALLGAVKNYADEAKKDQAQGKLPEAPEAAFFFLFGLFSSLRTLMLKEVLRARSAALAASEQRLLVLPHDELHAYEEASIWDRAAVRASTLRHFEVKLGLRVSPVDEDALQRAAKLYDAFAKGTPRA